jgi:hypothetical protein
MHFLHHVPRFLLTKNILFQVQFLEEIGLNSFYSAMFPSDFHQGTFRPLCPTSPRA